MILKVIRRTHRKIKAPAKRKAVVKVGFPAGESDSETVQKAVWNEFGTRGGASGGGWGGPIPERPFMRNSVQNNRGKYKSNLKAAARSILDGTQSVEGVLRSLGDDAKGDIQKEIKSLMSPPNSPVTVALKGSSKPLVDTGEMMGAVTYKVET